MTLATKTLPISRQAAATELLARRHARRDLLSFTNYTFPGYKTDPAHALIASYLDQIVDNEVDRLMIFAPPQHGKSELVSRRLPAFWFGRRPDDPVILTSYAASLAHSMSRDARNIVEDSSYARLFDVQTDPSSRAVDHWRLRGHRGELIASGVGGPITGHGASLGIIDDPFENWEQAQSKTYRDKVWDWWRSTFRTRIWEGGAIVLVMTRWHEDDLAGRLLQDQRGRWTILRLPAIAETQADRDDANTRLGLKTKQRDPLRRRPGQALCPRRFSNKALKDIRTEVGSIVWFSEYQGTPRAPEGNTFKREWLTQTVPDYPKPLDAFVRYWDKAGTQDAGAFTCGPGIGRKDGRYYVIDVVRGQWSSGQRNRIIRQTAEQDSHISTRGNVITYVEQEPGSGGKESAEITIRELAGFVVKADRVTGDKEVRAGPFAAQCEAGNVILVQAPWNRRYIDELCAFPNGRFADQVDGSSGAFNKVVARPQTKVVIVEGRF